MRILVIEDEKKTAAFLAKGLREAGFTVDLGRDGETGLELARATKFDLLIVDIMLPNKDGWQVVAELRRGGMRTPILFLTARDSVRDRVKGLELGADDYLVKPFAFSELLARVRSLLRRAPAEHEDRLRIDDLELDLNRHKAVRSGVPLNLTPKEFLLLAHLVRSAGEVVSRAEIAEHVWDIGFTTDTNVVEVVVRRLRAKVDDPFDIKLVHTIRGVGYVLKRTKPRSIAAKLVLLFTLTATLLLSCGLGVFYWIVVRHAFAEDNAVLADKISGLSADFKEGRSGIFGEELRTQRAGEHLSYWIRVLASGGRTVTETPGMDLLIPPGVFPPAQGSTSSIRNPKDYRAGAKLFALVAVNEKSGGQTYTIQVAQDRSIDEQLKRRFGVLLGVVLAGSVLASAIIAITVTKHGLRPLGEMTRSLERIGPAHLNERVAPAGWPRELQPLATTFDAMLARLEDSFKRLSQFSADLAHELRTPVANIMGEGQVALTRERTPSEYREVIESSVAECERLSGIVDNLLFVARADAARESIERKKFDGDAAVEKIAAFYRTLAEDRNVAIHCSGEGEIYADLVLFERAVSNLVDNALRFIPDGGEIKISVMVRDAHSEIAVSDNGSGIAPEHLPRVFDRFYRADPSRSSGGAGLGLALVKSIVDLHGGTARIQSEAGRGTTVVLTFPNKTAE